MNTPTKTILLAAIGAAFAFPCTSHAGPPAAKAVIDKKAVVPAAEEDFPVHPISDPYWAEDSFTGSDLRPVFAYHHFPGEVLGGGHAIVAAAQLRIQITKSLQFVAYKDGYMEYSTRAYEDRGWNDIAAGIKWAFYQDDVNKLYASVGVGYEFASGDDNVLQDDDGVRIWAALNKGFGKLHVGATVNYFISTKNGDSPLGDSNNLTWHLHADYQVCKWFSPVVEFNGYHVYHEMGPVTPFGGSDVVNLGGNRNETVITFAVGAEVRPCKYFSVRAAYEIPLTDDVDIWGHRWTFSSVIPF